MTQSHPPAWAAFTDGSCWHKDRVGGWAWVAFNIDSEEHSGVGYEKNTTISRMELMAPIDFLDSIWFLQGPSHLLVYSDSEYVVKGIVDRTRARTKNNDLWDRLDELVDRHHMVKFEHVKGHDTSYYNDKADRLAGAARKAGQKKYS